MPIKILQGANKYLLPQTLKYFELSLTGIKRGELIGPAGYNIIPFAASQSVILATQLASFKMISPKLFIAKEIDISSCKQHLIEVNVFIILWGYGDVPPNALRQAFLYLTVVLLPEL